MTDDPKKKMKQAAQDIDVGLNSLFGALGDAIGDMVSRLEEGNSGAVTRDHVIETDKGPMRAHAGIRVQMGGLGAARSTGDTVQAKPVNPSRPKPARTPAATAKPLEYDVFEDQNAWIFTADLPGVARDDLSLAAAGTHLDVTTSGTRLFEARVDLGKPFDLEGIDTQLHNGVLTLNIPKVEAT